MPFGVDALVIYLAARDAHLFWIYPLLATAGSVAGAAMTFWVGRKAGEVGLDRFVPRRRLKRLRSRVHERGAVALAFPAFFPPPFPLTPLVLTCGALEVNPKWFFSTFAVMRLLRFSIGAFLARVCMAAGSSACWRRRPFRWSPPASSPSPSLAPLSPPRSSGETPTRAR